MKATRTSKTNTIKTAFRFVFVFEPITDFSSPWVFSIFLYYSHLSLCYYLLRFCLCCFLNFYEWFFLKGSIALLVPLYLFVLVTYVVFDCCNLALAMRFRFESVWCHFSLVSSLFSCFVSWLACFAATPNLRPLPGGCKCIVCKLRLNICTLKVYFSEFALWHWDRCELFARKLYSIDTCADAKFVLLF